MYGEHSVKGRSLGIGPIRHGLADRLQDADSGLGERLLEIRDDVVGILDATDRRITSGPAPAAIFLLIGEAGGGLVEGRVVDKTFVVADIGQMRKEFDTFETFTPASKPPVSPKVNTAPGAIRRIFLHQRVIPVGGQGPGLGTHFDLVVAGQPFGDLQRIVANGRCILSGQSFHALQDHEGV